MACHHPENFEDQAPQDTVLLSAAKDAGELVPDAVLAESAETSAALAGEVGEEPAGEASPGVGTPEETGGPASEDKPA